LKILIAENNSKYKTKIYLKGSIVDIDEASEKKQLENQKIFGACRNENKNKGNYR